ncbi:phosphoribosylformylglycinamidine cyclo-ligase [bacterium]|nr:MAG: phosphoribosylformylglycinamidine cyclo-ligase [bacterium]
MTVGETYKKAGVDILAAEKAKNRIARLAKETFTPDVMSEIGAFGGVFRFPSGSDNLLLASADGVGTKTKVASAAGIYNTVGRDLVNHCVNDLLVHGAEPLFFLDYIGYANLEPERVAEIVEGLSIACRRNGLALIGGETAQMPGVYSSGDFDLVGFIIGKTTENALIDGSKIRPGDKLIALSSNGLQTNGYSLARMVLLDSGKFKLDDTPKILNGVTVGEALLAIHPSYRAQVGSLLSTEVEVHGMAHITGGGIQGNLIRVLPDGCAARVDLSDVKIPSIFELIRREGNIPPDEMYRVFNMGVGYLLVVPDKRISEALVLLNGAGAAAVRCGEIVEGEKSVTLRRTV